MHHSVLWRFVFIVISFYVENGNSSFHFIQFQVLYFFFINKKNFSFYCLLQKNSFCSIICMCILCETAEIDITEYLSLSTRYFTFKYSASLQRFKLLLIQPKLTRLKNFINLFHFHFYGSSLPGLFSVLSTFNLKPFNSGEPP